MKKLKSLLSLFFTFFKIGLFTFGGGYAMISVMEREFVEKKKYLNNDEYLDIIGIAESTPGPIAINSATFIGYKRAGFLGSLFSTVGVVLPSFIIIFTISLFFDKFLSLKWVQWAFRGIEASVVFIILSAGIKMGKKLDKSPFNIIMLIISVAVFLTLTFTATNFSSVFFILIGGGIGIFLYLISLINSKKKGDK